MSAGSFCKKRTLLGGRYSSGMDGAAAAFVDLRPVAAFLAGRPSTGVPAGATGAAAAARFRDFWASSSWACFRSVYGE